MDSANNIEWPAEQWRIVASSLLFQNIKSQAFAAQCS